jgi:class I lanthipeptide synthase
MMFLCSYLRMSRRPPLEHHHAAAFFVLRAPRLPFVELAGLCDDDLAGRMRALSGQPEFRESLLFASPGVDDQAQRWDELAGARGQQLTATIYKYLSRMTTRCAPFGTFAGYAVGSIGSYTHFNNNAVSGSRIRRVAEISPSWLRRLIDGLQHLLEVRQRSSWDRNPTARIAADVIRYVERQVVGGSNSYALSEVETSPLIVAALDAANGTSIEEITAAVTAAGVDLSCGDARQVVEDLIDVQLLVSDFELPLSSLDPAHDAVRLLRRHGLAEAADGLERGAADLQMICSQPLGVPVDAYRGIAVGLQPDGDPARMFNAKLIYADTPELGPEVIAELDRAVSLLHRLGRAEAGPLPSFISAFVERYGAREVPLLEALDPETGIAFPPITPDASSLIADLPFEPAASQEGGAWLDRDAILLNLLCDAMREDRDEIALTEEDIARLAGHGEPLPLPDTFITQSSIAARSEEAVRNGDFRLVIEGLAGPSGASMFTRFCGTDPLLLERVREHIADEERQRPDALFAEVLHLPEGTHAVLAGRPAIRRYEIPLLAASSLPGEQQITLDDLLVFVAKGRVVLRSRRHGREVIPRMTTALNVEHERGIALFRFFGALTRQEHASRLYWDWGQLASANYLPRVTAGRIVLAGARWRVTREEADEISPAWCVRRRLPRFVRIRGELVVDLSTAIGRATLADAARRGVVVTELLPAPEDLWLGGERPHVHEILVPYVSTREPIRTPQATERPEAGQRVFVPGSEWLYAKLYTGPSSADRILTGPIAALVEELKNEGVIDRWFFIRYADPDWHLRVRFHGAAGALAAAALPRLRNALEAHLDAGVVARLELATYDREVERYGGWEAIEPAEEIFHADSDAVVAILSGTGGDEDERWRAAVAGADALLDDFRCALETKRVIVQNLRMTQARRFRLDKPFVRQLGDRYRRVRAEVERAMTERELFADRSRRLAPVLEELRRREQAGRLSEPLDGIARSVVHMFFNRLFRGAHPPHEYVICDFLDRAYESAAMRSRASI